MNERIKQLLIQSEVFNKDGTILKDVTGYELNKFAELIVQECVNVMHDNDLWIPWNRHISHVLREHFGVEE